jgi:hypothetical protein
MLNLFIPGGLDIPSSSRHNRHSHSTTRRRHRSSSHHQHGEYSSDEELPSTSEHYNTDYEREYESEGVMNTEKGMWRVWGVCDV